MSEQHKPHVPGGRVRVTQIGSAIGRPEYQEQTLRGLGLNKRHRSRILKDSAEVRGMITRVHHLVTVEELPAEEQGQSS